jgi:hypothetical protein
MPVYVDHADNLLGRMKMCHMVADTVAELHAMADKIGMRRAWFQPLSSPHYDVCKSRRAQAISFGAIEVSRRELAAIIKRCRPGWVDELIANDNHSAPAGWNDLTNVR